MVSGTLYTYPENFRAYKALVAAQYASSDVKVAQNFVFGETNETEAFLKKFPSGKVPAFESSDGQYLNDSNAIAYFVANQQLRGKTVLEQSQVLQWISFSESDLLPAACAWLFPILGIMNYQKQQFERAKEDMKQYLSLLDKHLLTRTFLVGERVSLADIAVSCTLLNLYVKVLDPEYRKPYVNVNRWFLTVVNQKQFKAVIGEVKLCNAVANPEAGGQKGGQQQQQQAAAEKDKPSLATNAGNKKKSKGKDKKDEKKKEKKQTPKKEEAPAAAEEMDLADEALAAEPKSKDPFDTMPKGTFNIDDFKRVYSNEDESKSIPYFWEKFDSENYSIWYGEYKYPNELTKVFMSCNLITGMFQRLDKMRKQAFASACLFGKDDDSTISAIWVWRGQELAFTLCPDWQIDYESYEWKKLDPKDENTKKLVTQYFSWTGNDKNGRAFNQGKIFK